jgi:D-beta-D-heptose 7-phosphate kinase/D-beta-D-heptose 1-phosphate adenosyltransferase
MVITFDQLPEIRKKHSNQRIVFCGGVFDIIHHGHAEALEYRRSLGDILVCGIVTDKRARQRKRSPVRSEQGRLEVIEAFRAVDYVFLLPMPLEDDMSALQVIEALRPDIYIERSDNLSPWTEEKITRARALGTELKIDTLPKRDSSTRIMRIIARRVK